jgi:hypothetical protein
MLVPGVSGGIFWVSERGSLMTLIVAAVLEEGAIVVSDSVAQDTAGEAHYYEKLSVSSDGQDLFGVAGTTDFAESYLAPVMQHHGIDCDDEIENRFRVYADFSGVPYNAASTAQECLHAFQGQVGLVVTQHEAMKGHLLRSSVGRNGKKVGIVTIGSGSLVFQSLVLGGDATKAWLALQRRSAVSERDVYTFLSGMFRHEAMQDEGIGALADAYVLRDGRWSLWP